MLPHTRLAFKSYGKSCAASPVLSRSVSEESHHQLQASGSLLGNRITVRSQKTSSETRRFVNQSRSTWGSHYGLPYGGFRDSAFYYAPNQWSRTVFTSTRRHQRAPLPYKRTLAKSQTSPNEEQLIFDSLDGLHDTFDFGPSEELQDMNKPKRIPSIPRSVSKPTPGLAEIIPQPPTEIQPNATMQDTPKIELTTKPKRTPRVVEQRPPLPEDYIIIFQEAKRPRMKTQEKQKPTFTERLLASAKERSVKQAIATGATMPSTFAADRRPYLTPDDLRLREAWNQYAIDYGHKESAQRVEELASLGEKRPVPSLTRYWLRKLEEAMEEPAGAWSSLYEKDATPYLNMLKSLQNVSEEIGELYVDVDMEYCQPYLKHMQLEIQLHLQSIEESMHAYRLAVKQEGQALRILERGAISNHGDLFDAYSISKNLLKQPWENYKKSQSDLWRASRGLRAFREQFFGRPMTKEVRKRHEAYEMHLQHVLVPPTEIVEYYKQVLKTFCHEFENASARDLAMDARRSCNSMRVNLRSLEDLQTREGILPRMCNQGPESPWSHRQMIYLVGKVLVQDCYQMVKRLSEYEHLMLTFRQGPDVLENISLFYKPDPEHLLAQSKNRIARYGEAFLHELYQAQRFETEVDRLIDLCQSDQSGLESPYPIVRRSRFEDRSLKQEGLLHANYDKSSTVYERPSEDTSPVNSADMLDNEAGTLTPALVSIDEEIVQLAQELESISPGARDDPAASAQLGNTTTSIMSEDLGPTKSRRIRKIKRSNPRTPQPSPASSDALGGTGAVSPMSEIPTSSGDGSGTRIPPPTLGGLNLHTSQRLAYPDLSLSSFAIQPEPFYVTTDGPPSSHEYPPAHDDLETDASNSLAGMQHPSLDDEPFRSPRGFHIPSDIMRATLDAPENSEQSYWQHSLYRGPNGLHDTVKIHYCKNKEAMETVSKLFADEEILGFDIEWIAQAKTKDEIRRNVSLIQVASEDRIALFHIARFPGANVPDSFVTPAFKNIMESPTITKVGVAIKGDSTRLRNYLGIHCRGLFELSHLYKVLRHCYGQPVRMNKICVSLALQVKEHLNLTLLKGDVQTSDWSRDLTSKQVKYAASDSYAGFQLFHRMEAKRLVLNPVPPRPAHAELNQALLVTSEQEAAMTDGSDEESEESFLSFSESEDSVDGTVALTNDLSKLTITKSTTDELGVVTNMKEVKSADIATQETSSATKAIVPQSRQFDEANEWAASYKIANPERFQLSPAYLRAYHLWHHQQYDVGGLAGVLRDPPLRISTVIEYICEAVYRGPLPADPVQFAKMGSFDTPPYKEYHRRMIRAAVDEVERRKTLNSEEMGEEDDIGWWKRNKF